MQRKKKMDSKDIICLYSDFFMIAVVSALYKKGIPPFFFWVPLVASGVHLTGIFCRGAALLVEKFQVVEYSALLALTLVTLPIPAGIATTGLIARWCHQHVLITIK